MYDKENKIFISIKFRCIFPDFSYKNYKEFYILLFPQEYKSGRIKCDKKSKPSLPATRHKENFILRISGIDF